MTAPKHLSYGVLSRTTELEAWQAECIERLAKAPGVQLTAVLLAPTSLPGRATGPLTAARGRAWTVFNRRMGKGRSRAAVPVDIRLLTDEAIPHYVSRGGELSHCAGTGSKTIPTFDFVLAFGSASIDGLSALTRHGVWRFSHDADLPATPAFFSELLRGCCVSEVNLVAEQGDNPSHLLGSAVLRLNRHSYAKTFDDLAFGSVNLPIRACRELAVDPVRSSPPSPPGGGPRTDGPPSLLDLSFLLTSLAWQKVMAIRDYLFGLHEWAIGMVELPVHEFLGAANPPPVTWLSAPKDKRFLADPFPIERDGTLTILAEEYDFATARGVISACTFQGGQTELVHSVLPVSGHAAYPFLFESGGELYCVPSIAGARSTTLYRCQHFPVRWKEYATILNDFHAADATIFQHGGWWWLFCTQADTGANSELHAFYAADLVGPWNPHPLNPLKVDVRSARPAGTPFRHEGALYRPAQDCSSTYGAAVVLNRVSRLDTESFEESPVIRIPPWVASPYPDGLHTLNGVGEFTIIDSKRERLTATTTARRIGYLVRRRRGSLRPHERYS